MSLNTAHTDGGVVIHQGEMILLHAKSTLLSFSGSDELKSYGELTGNSYLTTHRLIFLTKGSKSNLKSFSLPFCVLSEVDVEQPVFGANYLKGKVRAQPNGNWRGEAKWKLQFKAGGAIDFAQGMLRAIHIARQTTAQNQYWNEPPPAYFAATFMPAPSAYYAPPPNYYGWSYESAYQFPPPEVGTIYIYEAPPPYPGIGGGNPPPPQYSATGYGQQPPNANYYNGAPPQQQSYGGYGPPQQPGYFPPQQPGYAPPQQPGYAPPQPGYAPPQQPGYAPPQPGYAPPQQPGYAPPQQPAYAPTQQPGYAPPQQPGFGYAPPQQPGDAPPQYTPQYNQAGPMNGNASSAPPYSELDKKQN